MPCSIYSLHGIVVFLITKVGSSIIRSGFVSFSPSNCFKIIRAACLLI